MKKKTLKNYDDCRILVVDDEEPICDLLETALEETYRYIDTCYTAGDAISLMDKKDYDIVITDLKLPDKSGLEVLKYAKSKDDYIEVIIITGYASLDSAAEAINLGVNSYQIKPLNINNFLSQVDKAVATRFFHLKSVMLMHHTTDMIPEIKSHLQDITSLYYFSRKLMLPLEMSEIMRVILEEADTRLNLAFSCLGINYKEFQEIFCMPGNYNIDKKEARDRLLADWNDAADVLDKSEVEAGDVSLTLLKGKKNGFKDSNSGMASMYMQLTVLGSSIGFIAIYFGEENTVDKNQNQYLHVFTSIISSVVEHACMDLQAKKQAKTDSLTGVANHRMFHETIEREISRAERYSRMFSLLFIDIDDFKKINDTYGHLVGDAVLIDLTKRINKKIRCGDVLARYGGEEFMLLLPDTEKEGAVHLAQRICRAISSSPFCFSRKNIRYTISIGVSTYTGSKKIGKENLIRLADEALYDSKESGKNRVTAS